MQTCKSVKLSDPDSWNFRRRTLSADRKPVSSAKLRLLRAAFYVLCPKFDHVQMSVPDEFLVSSTRL